jgi:hypothetical protein
LINFRPVLNSDYNPAILARASAIFFRDTLLVSPVPPIASWGFRLLYSSHGFRIGTWIRCRRSHGTHSGASARPDFGAVSRTGASLLRNTLFCSSLQRSRVYFVLLIFIRDCHVSTLVRHLRMLTHSNQNAFALCCMLCVHSAIHPCAYFP